ncbi:MAG: efflux RND transporter periplasmic adaptor subunit [Verrucomicrobiae bacterium]|nr:efflux RND transporter periplasmic adaptor subunit [Verrucomicrobiae bacterium]
MFGAASDKMDPEKLKSLQIEPSRKRARRHAAWVIFALVLGMTAAALYLAVPRPEDKVRIFQAGGTAPSVSANSMDRGPTGAASPANSSTDDAVVLTVSGYIINRERIELSPRFLGVVKWIGVKKGDTVTNGQVVVLLDDTEQRARVREAEAAVAAAKVAVAKAELDYQRVAELAQRDVESRKAYDDARLALEAARAQLQQAEAALELAKVYLDWTVIRSPIDGVVLERLVEPNELVVPQSFGGTRGPSTALIALADPKDLQVEVDLNEADLSKVYLGQPCRISPEAYPDKVYDGYVAEIAPEANRQKGTLQVKVQIRAPDKYLTPELSARVDFLKK